MAPRNGQDNSQSNGNIPSSNGQSSSLDDFLDTIGFTDAANGNDDVTRVTDDDAGDEAPDGLEDAPSDEEQLEQELDDLSSGEEDRQPARKPDGRKRQQEQEPAPRQQAQEAPLVRYQQDAKGNLINPATGKIIAKAGAEARYYRAAHKAQAQASSLQLQLRQAMDGVKRAAEIADSFKKERDALRSADTGAKLGLSPAETAEALQLAASFRTPEGAIKALKTILTRMAVNGVDLKQLGLNAGAPVEMTGLIDIIKTEIGKLAEPIKADQEERRKQREARTEQQKSFEEAARETAQFFADHPDAAPYGELIKRAYEDPNSPVRNWSLREVWQQIQLHLLKTPQQRTHLNGRNANQRRPMPRGRQIADNHRGFDPRVAAPASTSYDDIVREIFVQDGRFAGS